MGIAERKVKQKAELRQQILDASVKLFSEHGYEGVSIRKIADLIEYSPTTVYLYFSDKNEILYDLHEIGFRKFEEFNLGLAEIHNPLLRLQKMGENYVRFGLENPEYYDLMFMLPAPMEFLCGKKDQCWTGGDRALSDLKGIISECMEKKLIKSGDPDAMALVVWAMVHGIVSLTIRKRIEKLFNPSDIEPAIQKALSWMMNILDVGE